MLKWNATPNPDPIGEPEGEISHPDQFDNHSSLVLCVKDGMRLLQKYYPGHKWGIQLNEKGRMISVFNLLLHDVWGYTIRADEVEHDPRRRRFLTAGGELLERFGLRPGKFDLHAYAALPKDIKGRCIPIISDLEHANARKEMKKRKLADAIARGHFMVDANGIPIVAVS